MIREPHDLSCPCCGVEDRLQRSEDGRLTTEGDMIFFCTDAEGRFIDPDAPTAPEEVMTLFCEGCSHMWNYKPSAALMEAVIATYFEVVERGASLTLTELLQRSASRA